MPKLCKVSLRSKKTQAFSEPMCSSPFPLGVTHSKKAQDYFLCFFAGEAFDVKDELSISSKVTVFDLFL